MHKNLNRNGSLGYNQKQNDFPADKIFYINLRTLRKSVNNGKPGSFGDFDVYPNNNGSTRKIIGHVTYEDARQINKLVGQGKNF